MASGDLLKQLFRGYVRHQDQEVRAAALRIIAEEKQKNHHSLAEQLERILVNGTFALPRETTQTSLEDLPRDRERSTVLVEVRTPRHFLQEMVLSPI